MSSLMIVKRIVANFASAEASKAKEFYADVLGLEVVMDLGWIITFEAPSRMAPQVSIASEGGSGALVPDLSVEVDNLDEALQRVRDAGLAIEYGPANEPWKVRRFYVRDPLGRLVNILAHE
jgi:catechol 2,3-dioxygenase-like lactoylglutathione lyase family enzyme